MRMPEQRYNEVEKWYSMIIRCTDTMDVVLK